MSDIEKTPEYFSWIGELKKRYRATQIKGGGFGQLRLAGVLLGPWKGHQ